jgi:hypothetical protein
MAYARAGAGAEDPKDKGLHIKDPKDTQDCIGPQTRPLHSVKVSRNVDQKPITVDPNYCNPPFKEHFK